MKKKIVPTLLALNGAVLMTAAPAMAIETTGLPGSPSATTTIDGKQLPPPPEKFKGKIGKTVKDSKPYWPARIVPPKGTPNVLLIMTDDCGFGAPGGGADTQRRRETPSASPAAPMVRSGRACGATQRRIVARAPKKQIPIT